jgi:hypothetical protein
VENNTLQITVMCIDVTEFMDAGLNFVSVPPTYDSLRTSLYRQRHKGIILIFYALAQQG